MKRESSESDTDKPSTSGILEKASKMAFEKTQKRVGKRPGRKPSKIDQKAKLERSRQSARECRARKKLRYQYLEELVTSREKAVFSLRDEVEMFKKWCSDLDRGIIPEGLLKMLAQEEMRNVTGQTANELQPKGGNPSSGQMSSQLTLASQSMLSTMHRATRSFEESTSASSSLLARQRSDSAPNLAGISADGSSHIFLQQSAGQSSNHGGSSGISTLAYKDFNPQSNTNGALRTPNNTGKSFRTAFYPSVEQGRSSMVAATCNPTTAGWRVTTGEEQYTNRLRALSRTNPPSSFGASCSSLAQNSQVMFQQGGESVTPVTTLQSASSDFSQNSLTAFSPSKNAFGVGGNLHSAGHLPFRTAGAGGREKGITVASAGMVEASPRITQLSLMPTTNSVVTCSPSVLTTQNTVTSYPGSELTASISEPIPHWYSFLDDLESANVSTRQGSYSAADTPSSVGTPNSSHSNCSGPGTPSRVSTPSSVGSPFSATSQSSRQQQRQQTTTDAGNIPIIISDILGHRSAT